MSPSVSRPDPNHITLEGLPALPVDYSRVVAFDPGTKNGTFCSIWENSWVYDSINGNFDVYFDELPLFPNGRVNYEDLHFLFQEELTQQRTLYVYEDVWVMPKQGVVSSAKFIEAYAAVRAYMTARAAEYSNGIVAYRPQEWKPLWKLENSSKSSSCESVLTEYPSLSPLLRRYSPKTGRKLKALNHNRAEAFLLALTACRMVD